MKSGYRTPMTSGMGSIVGDAVRARRVIARGAERQCMRTSASTRPCMAENAFVAGRSVCKLPRGRGICGRSSAAQAGGILEGAEKFEPTRPAQQTVEECWYDWKCGSRVGYVKAGDGGPPLLLVHGFGVGHWHFEHNIEELSRICRVYAVDLIGQGSSWPSPEGSLDLQFSAETWVEQLASFTTDVVQDECGDEQPVYVAGNSLGGYLAVALAAQHPGLVKGVALLNSTPFWGTGPNPETSPVLSSAMPYNGLGEPPKLLKWAVEKLWFNKLRSSNTVEWLIRQVYSAPDAVDGRLVANIVNAADHPLALQVQAFISVFFSPASVETFDDFVKDMQCPACMLYGKEDPWVKPLWGQRLKRLKPEMDYFELSPCGHCPHHETPEAVNLLLTGWLQAQERGGDCPLPTGRTLEVPDRTGSVTVTHVDGSPRTWLEKCDYAVWQLMRWFRSRSSEQAI